VNCAVKYSITCVNALIEINYYQPPTPSLSRNPAMDKLKNKLSSLTGHHSHENEAPRPGVAGAPAPSPGYAQPQYGYPAGPPQGQYAPPPAPHAGDYQQAGGRIGMMTGAVGGMGSGGGMGGSMWQDQAMGGFVGQVRLSFSSSANPQTNAIPANRPAPLPGLLARPVRAICRGHADGRRHGSANRRASVDWAGCEAC
jgi:hypothetical protein